MRENPALKEGGNNKKGLKKKKCLKRGRKPRAQLHTAQKPREVVVASGRAEKCHCG